MMSAEAVRLLQEQVNAQSSITEKIKTQLRQIVIGQHALVDRLLVGLYANGHLLLEGVPGLAKTLSIKSLAQTLHLSFSRIQFTPDLLPADVVGTLIYHQQRGEFVVRKGPIFANFVLADEINRAPAKVQSALLEAMQEQQVTLGDTTYPLEQPFLVLATQNPLEQEGTYPLPEAQQDRFLLKIRVSYPSRQEELQIVRENITGLEGIQLQAVATAADVQHARQLTRKIYMTDQLENYLMDIVMATREPAAAGLPELVPMLQYGASPRASIGLALASRALALVHHRAYVTPDDIKQIAPDVLRHRIGLTYEAAAEEISADTIIAAILAKVKTP